MAFNTEELLQLMLGPKVKIWPKSERAHDRLFTFCLQGVSSYERILIHELQVTIWTAFTVYSCNLTSAKSWICCFDYFLTTQDQLNKLISTTEPVVYSLCSFKYFINASSMHSSMHYQCIHHCIINEFINAFINASSMHRATYHQRIINVTSMHSLQHLSMHPQCAINASSMYLLHQMHQFLPFSSSFHHQCVSSTFINASSMY